MVLLKINPHKAEDPKEGNMRIIYLFIYMILGLFAARQLQIGLVKNARGNGVDTAPLRSRKFHRFLVAYVLLFTGFPYLIIRFFPGAHWPAIVVYGIGFFFLTCTLLIMPSQAQLGWAMIAYAVAAVISSYQAYLSSRFEFFSSILAVAAASLLLVGVLHFLRKRAEEDDEEDIESAADSAMLEAAKAVITPSRVLTVLLAIACLVAGKFLLQQLGIM